MIAKALADNSETDVDTCADNLQQLALNVPGDDNICIVLASLLDDHDPRAVNIGPLRRFLNRLFAKD